MAALLVVMYHIPNWNTLAFNVPLIRGGGAMVDLFFVLSGFVIYTAYHGKLNQWSDFFRFQFLRFGRLYPVHLFFILVYLGIETLKYLLQTHFGVASHSRPPFVENNFWAFFRELLLIKAFWSNDTAMAVTSPSWSISAEFYTYVIFGLTTLLAQRFKQWLFVALGIAGLLVLAVYQPSGYDFMLRCVTGFFTGCMVAMLIIKNQQTPKLQFHALLIPVSMVLIAIISISTHGAHGLGLMIYPASALLITSIVLSDDNLFNQLLSHRWLVWLGTISYSLYMSHGAVLWFFQQGLRFLIHPPEVKIGSLSVIQLGLAPAICAMVIYLGISLTVGYLIYLKIEKPYREKSRRLIKM